MNPQQQQHSLQQPPLSGLPTQPPMHKVLTPVDEHQKAVFVRHESQDMDHSTTPIAIKLYGYDCDKVPNVRLYLQRKPDLSKEIVVGCLFPWPFIAVAA